MRSGISFESFGVVLGQRFDRVAKTGLAVGVGTRNPAQNSVGAVRAGKLANERSKFDAGASIFVAARRTWACPAIRANRRCHHSMSTSSASRTTSPRADDREASTLSESVVTASSVARAAASMAALTMLPGSGLCLATESNSVVMALNFGAGPGFAAAKVR